MTKCMNSGQCNPASAEHQIPLIKRKKAGRSGLAKIFKRIIFAVLHFVYEDKIVCPEWRVIKICKIPVVTISKEYDI